MWLSSRWSAGYIEYDIYIIYCASPSPWYLVVFTTVTRYASIDNNANRFSPNMRFNLKCSLHLSGSQAIVILVCSIYPFFS